MVRKSSIMLLILLIALSFSFYSLAIGSVQINKKFSNAIRSCYP